MHSFEYNFGGSYDSIISPRSTKFLDHVDSSN